MILPVRGTIAAASDVGIMSGHGLLLGNVIALIAKMGKICLE